MADGGRRVEVDRIDPATCAIVERRDARIDPYDPEDLALGPDGALWVGDIGDNEHRRESVAVVVLPRRGSGHLHRFVYPDGPHDAEALLVDGAGRPVIVTKEVGGLSGIYRPATMPSSEGPTPLDRVGGVRLPASDTAGGPIGAFGSSLITGAAQQDGVVALRSYTDAWLYPAANGDVVAALGGDPVRVPLPGEPQGEAIAFNPAGTLVSGSEARGGTPGQIRTVPGAADLVRTAPATPEPAGAPGQAAPAWWSAAVGGSAVVLVLLLGMVAMAVRAARRS